MNKKARARRPVIILSGWLPTRADVLPAVRRCAPTAAGDDAPVEITVRG